MLPFARLGLLSRREAPHPFGRDADGTLFGEGAGLLVLKRRADAERDGDRVYALLKGVGLAAESRAPAPDAPMLEAQQILRDYLSLLPKGNLLTARN